MPEKAILRIASVLSLATLLSVTAAATPALSAPQDAQGAWVDENPTALRSAEEIQQEIPPVETRLYALSHVDLDSAYQLASSVCREIPPNRRGSIECNVSVMGEEGTLIVTTTAELHTRLAALLTEVDRPPHTQTFQIIVLAATDTASTPSDLPQGAQRAVEDIIDFLPYAGFRVLDSGWLKTVREGQTSLTGPTGFEVELRFRGDSRSNEQLLVERFSMTARVPFQNSEGQRGYRHEMILHTSFSMDVGETVVVGTSKLNGGEEPTALVILLTALEEEGTR
jgi:hypothetical protein